MNWKDWYLNKDKTQVNSVGKAYDAYTGINTLGLMGSDFQGKLDNKKADAALADADAQAERPYSIDPNIQKSSDLALQEYLGAKNRSKYGFSDAEKNLALNTNAQNLNLGIMNAERAGGNAGAFVNSTINQANNDFGLNFAAKDAELQRMKSNDVLDYLRNYNSIAGIYQDVNNAETKRLFDLKLLKEQMAGMAKQNTLQRQAERNQNYANIGTSLATAGMSGGGFGGSNTTPSIPNELGNTYTPAPSGTP